MSYDEVTHIFVRINSGGTKLGSADLALAQISSRWRGVTDELDNYIRDVKKRTGGELDLDTGIIVRTLSVMLSGRTRLSELFRGERQDLKEKDLQKAWARVEWAMDYAIAFLTENCEIDFLSLLPTQYILITLSAYFDHFEDISPAQARDLRRWVYMALIWTRYSGPSETSVDQDVAGLKSGDSIAQMIQNIEDAVGRNRPVTERELQGQLMRSPYMLMAYVLAREENAEDWFSGIKIGSGQSLEVHHIFPKDILREHYDLKTDRLLTDQVANLAFLSQKANLKIRNSPPSEYLATIPETRLRAQRVPVDRQLWHLEQFEDFLRDRRIRLAEAINELLNSLGRAPALWPATTVELLENRIDVIERQTRQLVAGSLVGARGKYAIDLIPAKMRNELQSRVDKHLEKNPADAGKFDELDERLQFALFSDYSKIILANWSIFASRLGDEAKLAQHFQPVISARNAFKHNQNLTNADRALAEAGLIWLEDTLKAWSIAVNSESDDDEENEEA